MPYFFWANKLEMFMLIRNWIVCFLLIELFSPLTYAESRDSKGVVYETQGNIFIKFEDKTTQLTKTGTDSEPILSPDGRWVAFNREIEEKVKECKENDMWECPSDELWIFNLKARSERMLLQPREYAPKVKAEEVIEKFYRKMFSPDNTTIYFSTPTYATASAIHAVDVEGKNLRFITAGHLVRVVQRALPEKFKNYLTKDLQEDDWRISEERGGLSLRPKVLKDEVAGYLIIHHSGIKTVQTPTLQDDGWEESDGKYYLSFGRSVWLSLDSPDGNKRIPLEKER